MRWQEARKLIAQIQAERPELSVDHHGLGDDHVALRISCLKQGPGDTDTILPFHPVPGSVDTIYGQQGWKRYLERHPLPFCRPEDSYHTDAMEREVDHRDCPVQIEQPQAPGIRAEAMLGRLTALNHSNPDWWRDQAIVAEIAAAWGVRTRDQGVMDFESEEVARVSGNCHASILIARTGSGLFASGYAARWGDGGTSLEPTVMSAPPRDRDRDRDRGPAGGIPQPDRRTGGREERQQASAAASPPGRGKGTRSETGVV